MTIKLYAIKDNVAGTFAMPQGLENDAVAKRSLTAVVNSLGNPVSDNPQDYDLYCLGDYDVDTGVISPLKDKIGAVYVCSAISCLINSEVKS